MKDVGRERREFVAPVGGGVRSGNENAGPLFKKQGLHLFEADRRRAGAPRQAERLERAPREARLDRVDQIIGNDDRRLERAREQAL